jgi:YVTN family beta-propeller protein
MPSRSRKERTALQGAWWIFAAIAAVLMPIPALAAAGAKGEDSATAKTSLINPGGIIFNPASGKVYAVDTEGGAVYVSDDHADTTVRVKVGAGPVSIAVDDKNGRAYVASADDGTVSVIDGRTDQVIDVVKVGSHPYSIAADSTKGRVYLTRTYSNKLTVIDAGTGRASEVEAGGEDLIAVNPKTSAVYLLGYEGGNLVTLDGTSFAKGEVSAGMHGWGIVVDPDSGSVYVLRTGNAEVAVFGADGKLAKRIAVGNIPSAGAFDSETKTLYVANYGDDTLTVIDAQSGVARATVAVGHHPEAVAVDVERNLVFVANTHGNSVTVIDGASNKVRATVAAGKFPYALAYNPVSKKLHIANVGGAPVTAADGGGKMAAR